MTVKLYSINISHPSRTAGLMLRHKGIEHEIVDIPPGMQPVLLRVSGFRGPTVPAVRIDGRKVQGSLEISRALEELQPEPPLYPADPTERTAVEEAEYWGEAVFQPVPRKLFRWMASRDQGLRRGIAEAAGMPAPAVTSRLFKPAAWYFRRVSHADAESSRQDLATLPAKLDHVDELIAGGVIGAEQPNAADFQIATTVRVLMNYPQLQAAIESRPAGELATRLVPGFGKPFPIHFDPEWIPAAVNARV